MNITLDRWLSHLPLAEEEAGDGIVLDGWLIPSEAGRIRIVVGELCLSFFRSDVIEIEPVVMPADPLLSSKAAIRVVVRREAPILDIRLHKLCNGFKPQRRPFALSARPRTLTLGPVTRFRDLERQFLLTHSLIDT